VDEHAEALADAVERVLPAWVERSVCSLVTAYRGALDAETIRAAREAGERARREVGAELRALLSLDVDAQRTNPLSVLRGAVRYPTDVLRQLGIPEVVRDAFAERAFPHDVYDLSPASWRDVDESLHDLGIVWGAAKAQQHLRRRRAEGRLDP
jgi:hypothetical protein